jgi:hypothetical protein
MQVSSDEEKRRKGDEAGLLTHPKNMIVEKTNEDPRI